MTTPGAGSTKAAVIQLCSDGDISANLATCERLVGQAVEQGASLVVLPECFAFLGEREQDKFEVAEFLNLGPLPEDAGPIRRCITEMAIGHKLWVIAGGIPELRPEDAKLEPRTTAYNTCAVVDPAGELVSAYRKIHLFDVDIPGGTTLKESSATSAGSEVLAVDTSIGRVGLSICYDLRFPELYRELTLEHGAEVLVVPAAFTAHTGAAHWHTLLQARAIENQCWVLAAGQSGRHNSKRQSYGHSLIIDPWGVIRGEVVEGDGFACVEIDADFTAQKRTHLPCLTHSVLRKS
ncbi:MAG: carbon-nitrogen hydrolase family protein [Myxococcales bacterium]|nr:carbon-nitrogen hydrolase family protein [Myxococcales bacterium]